MGKRMGIKIFLFITNLLAIY